MIGCVIGASRPLHPNSRVILVLFFPCAQVSLSQAMCSQRSSFTWKVNKPAYSSSFRTRISSISLPAPLSPLCLFLFQICRRFFFRLRLPCSFCSVSHQGKAYHLVQFHFHSPSEHSVDGELMAAEMHLVHQAADGSVSPPLPTHPTTHTPLKVKKGAIILSPSAWSIPVSTMSPFDACRPMQTLSFASLTCKPVFPGSTL